MFRASERERLERKRADRYFNKLQDALDDKERLQDILTNVLSREETPEDQ